MRYFYSLILSVFCFLFVSGCSTTSEHEGGSSLPWSQPEPWENQVLPMGQGE